MQAQQGPAIEHDAFNETVVLRAAISSAEHRRSLVRQIAPAEFVAAGHDSLWAALRAMVDGGVEYTPEAARMLVKQHGGDPTLLDLLEPGADVVPNLEWHVATLRWDAQRVRIAKELLPGLVDQLVDPKCRPDELAATVRGLERAITESHGRSHIRGAGELARAYRAEIASRRAKQRVYPTGWAAVDLRLTEGLAPGKTWVVAGLPGSGKSTAMAALLFNLVKLNRRPFVGAWEMGPISLLDVLVSHSTGMNLRAIVRGDLDDEEVDRVTRASDFFCRKIKFMGAAFYDAMARAKNAKQRGRPSNDVPLDVLEGYLAESGCDVAVYDLWARCLCDRSPEGIESALFRQQAMHESLSIAGVIVTQMNVKDVEKRQDKRPTREGIKGSGAYTEVADLIFGVHRDAQFKSVQDDAIELICLKQRKGEVNWAVQFDWKADVCGISGGQEVPYDPGFDAVIGQTGDIAGIRTGQGGKGKRKSKGRDG